MKPRFFISVCLLFIFVGNIYSQTRIVNYDKKVIQCDSLNLPVTTTAYELMHLLPELLQRPGVSIFSNYEVKVEGMTLSEGKDEVLEHLQIEDINKIELDESPMSSYLQNGTSGSVNIVLKHKGKTSDKLWGSANMSVSYPLYLSPLVLLNHRTDKLYVTGILMGNLYNKNSLEENYGFDKSGSFQSFSSNYLEKKKRSQLAGVYLDYNPSAKNNFSFKLSENVTCNNTLSTKDCNSIRTGTNRQDAANVNALFKWKHNFAPNTNTSVEVQYVYNPSNTDWMNPAVQQYESHIDRHTVAGKLEFKTTLLPNRDDMSLNMTLGSNFNGSASNSSTDSYYFPYFISYSSNPSTRTFLIQPYLNFEYKYGKLKAKLNMEIQHFNYDISRELNNYKTNNTSVTGKAMAVYSFSPTSNLRLIIDRKIRRPSDSQLFPVLTFDSSSSLLVQGNPFLAPVYSHEVKLDYVADYEWGEHSLMFDAGLSYNNISNIISSVELDPYHISYENNGTNHIFSANVFTSYTYKIYSASLIANLFNNNQISGDIRNHYTYCNISFLGSFRPKDGWQGAMRLAYFSPVKRVDASLSDCAVANMSFGHKIKSVFVYAFSQVVLQDNAVDSKYMNDGSYSLRYYNMLPNEVGIGARYSF